MENTTLGNFSTTEPKREDNSYSNFKAAEPTQSPTLPQLTPEKNNKDNIVFIGSKPLMNYVTSIVMQFTTKNSPEVIIKARGKFISKAVDISEVARKRFLSEHNITTKDIKIDTEQYEKEGKKINVSTIDITLAKPNQNQTTY
jgi:archaea-specific DNA-binding protein